MATLCGGSLSEKVARQTEPTSIPDWSRSKYKRFIDTAGGWEPYQAVLRAASSIAKKHGVSLSNVASRWVLEHEAVAATIIGARLGESEHRDDNLNVFRFTLDAEDHAALDAAFAQTSPIPGDCGDEYRKPPFLTASGDLSHHLDAIPSVYRRKPCPAVRVACGFLRQHLGADCWLQPLRAGGQSRVRVRHNSHSWHEQMCCT